ncbi:MAG: MarR family transcriptional regulator [Clostridia bacterium]|nr:MarR family transcriptional regulator [Clostridia bacterium]
MNHLDHDVILASLKLARAMRRCPPERGEAPFPPAVGRLLACAAENPGVSSRELCELLDVRPSSLSEMLARAEADGLLTRTADEADKRIQRITLTEKGSRLISELKSARDEDARKKTSCLTEEEKKQFCELCNRLSEHIERLALDLPEDRRMPPPPPGPEFPHPGPEPDGPRPFPPRGPRYRC